MPNVPAWSPNWKEVRRTQDSLVHGVGRDNEGNTLRNAYVHKQQTHQSSSAEEVGKNFDVYHHTHSLPSQHHLVKKTTKKRNEKHNIISDDVQYRSSRQSSYDSGFCVVTGEIVNSLVDLCRTVLTFQHNLDRQTDRQTEKKKNMQADRKTDKKEDRQPDKKGNYKPENKVDIKTFQHLHTVFY